MTNDTALATSWLQALAARGVRVTIRNGRLRMHPEAAYKDLTDDERATLRHHRDEIKALVASGVSLDVRDTSADAVAAPPVAPVADPFVKAMPTAAPAPEPTTCPYCHQSIARCAEIKETRPDDFAVLHRNDPEEAKRRDDEATAVMMHQIGRGLPDWYR